MQPTLATPPRPYADAPTLPSGQEAVDVRALVRGEWIELEIGPGRGGFLFERARSAPAAGLVGFEVRRKWASVVDARLAERGLGARARVFAEDARLALARLTPDASVRRVFVHFPDPWWKKRHRKRTVVQAGFVREIVRLLQPGGELFVQTDVASRADAYEELLGSEKLLRAKGDDAGSARLSDNPYGAQSPRERRAQADGLPIYRLRYERTSRS